MSCGDSDETFFKHYIKELKLSGASCFALCSCHSDHRDANDQATTLLTYMR